MSSRQYRDGNGVTWFRAPATLSVCIGLVVLVAIALLSRVSPVGVQGQRFVASPGWQVWRGTAGFSVAVWVVLFAFGVQRLRARTVASATLAILTLAYILLAGLVGLTLNLIAPVSNNVPVSDWSTREGLLTLIAMASAAPWVCDVWDMHARLRSFQVGTLEFAEKPTDSSTASDWSPDDKVGRGLMQDITNTWEVIEVDVVALAVIVTFASLCTGALRLALVPDFVSAIRFPAYLVLLYGCFFAAILAAAVVPLIVSWRAKATALVKTFEPLPSGGRLSKEFMESRQRMETFLDIDKGMLRSPITTVSLLAPFVTAFLTTLVPIK